MTPLQQLTGTLQEEAGLQIIDANESPNQLRLMARIPLDRDGTNLTNWHILIARLLDDKAQQAGGWAVDISKNYFLRAGEVVFAWRLIFHGERLAEKYQHITQSLLPPPPAPHSIELKEFPLTGASPDRNNPDKNGGKGVRLVRESR